MLGRLIVFFVVVTLGLRAQNKINSYEYWFDYNYSDKTTVTIVPPAPFVQVATTLNTSSVQAGLHTVHLRFLDDNKNYSSVITQFFYKPSELSGITTSNVVAYEYWFDHDYQARVMTSFSGTNHWENVSLSVNTAVLGSGLHLFHIRFLDSQGKWSSVVSQFFYKIPNTNIMGPNNVITGYRYWLDNDFTGLSTIHLGQPTPVLLLNLNLNLVPISKGQHTIHFQFRDTTGNWSVVVSDTFVKQPHPLAIFSVNDSTICVGDTVYFTSTSIDADVHTWNFGNGNYGSTQSVSQVYLMAGVYTVSLTVQDTATGMSNTTTRNIYVTAYPSKGIHVYGNDTICSGQAVLLSLQATQANYLWNTGQQTPNITVGQAGAYYARVISNQNPSCAVYSDTIHIGVEPLPVVNLGNDTLLCEGASLSLDAYYPQANYAWNTAATTSSITVTQTGIYAVTVTSAAGCIYKDSIEVNVVPLPVADFSYTTDASTVYFSNQSVYATSFYWDFGDGSNSMQSDPVHDFPVSGGQFLVRLIAINNCGADTFYQTLTIQPVRAYEVQEKQFAMKLFPNPAREQTNLWLYTKEAAMVLLTIYDLTGKQIARIQPSSKPFSNEYMHVSFSTSSLPSGLYYIKVDFNGKYLIEKLTIVK